MIQIKELYYALFEKVHNNYAELIEDLDSNEAVKEFGRNGFANLEQAISSKHISRIKMEVIEFYQGFPEPGPASSGPQNCCSVIR